MKNIVVIFGGKSIEHDVSILSGLQVVAAIDRQKYSVYPIYIDKQNNWKTGKIDNLDDLRNNKLNEATFVCGQNTLYIKKKNRLKSVANIDVAINCCHGGMGERGELAGALAIFDVAYSSPNIYSSFITMDKELTKQKIGSMKLNQLKYAVIKKNYTTRDIEKIQFPVIIKPAQGGSSIGISIAKTQKELYDGLDLAHCFGDKAIVENLLEDFIEVNCAVLKINSGCVVSKLEYPKSSESFLSFGDKYLNFAKDGKVFKSKNSDGESEDLLSKEICDKIKDIAQRLYQKFDLFGVCRIDFMVKDEKIYVNELNSIPGSLANFLFRKDYNFTQLIDKIIEISLLRKLDEKSYISNFESRIIDN